MPTVHWRFGHNGNFATGIDWSTGFVPTAIDDVAIDAVGTYTVTVSASYTIRSLRMVSTATLAVTAGRFTITDGTGAGANAGTISVANGAALEIGGTFDNSGRIALNSTGLTTVGSTDLIIGSNVALTGGGEVIMSASGHDAIVGGRPFIFLPFLPALPFLPFLPFLSLLAPPSTLANVANTIVGAGSIGGNNLALLNEATIDGNSAIAALTINTGARVVRNSGLMEGTSAQGLVVDSNVANTGTLEAIGRNARLRLEATVTDSGRGSVKTSGDGAHVDLDSATIVGGAVVIGSGGIVDSLAGSGPSVISGAAVSGSGLLQADSDSRLSIINSTLATTDMLMANGNGSVLSVGGAVGALAGTINSGEIEFQGASAAHITFAPGSVGILKLDSSFTGTVSGFAGAVPMSFTNFFTFGDSTVDSGALQYLSPDLPSPPNPGLTDRLENALAAGGTNSPVGVGLMNTQLLAGDYGLTANTAYTTGGVVGGGGTNYAISGALDAADAGSGDDPGNGSVSNINQAGTLNPNPALLSTVSQLETYLNSVGGNADPSALYLVSSGGNDFSYATKFITDPMQRMDYLSAQAQTLATEIEKLSAAGAQHIIVNTSMNDDPRAIAYSGDLFTDLDRSGIAYIKSDVENMVQNVINDPTAYGFTSTTVHHGVTGTDTNTESALVEPDITHNLSGWGLWGADTTSQEMNLPTNQQYAYLSSPDAEQTHFFSDDQHLSAAGQQIQASFDSNLLTDDAIDFTSLNYAPGTTVASFSGTSSSGTLSVSNGTQSANITLLGNYLAAAFMTAGDGTGGTLVMDKSRTGQQLELAASHGVS